MIVRALVVAAALVAACRPGEPPEPNAYADEVWRVRCTPCHGARGEGGTSGLPVPSFRDAAWQARTSDLAIEGIVGQGGAAVGKNAAMPANPDLARSPEVLAALRRRVRSFAPPDAGHDLR